MRNQDTLLTVNDVKDGKKLHCAITEVSGPILPTDSVKRINNTHCQTKEISLTDLNLLWLLIQRDLHIIKVSFHASCLLKVPIGFDETKLFYSFLPAKGSLNCVHEDKQSRPMCIIL